MSRDRILMRRLSLANTLSQMDYLALMRIGYTLVVSVPVSQSDHSDRFRQVQTGQDWSPYSDLEVLSCGTQYRC